MGATSGGLSIIASKKRKYMTLRGRQRANLSFFIVVMFFAVFGIIVVTEVFFIDERSGAGSGVSGGLGSRHGTLSYQRRHGNRDYDEV